MTSIDSPIVDLGTTPESITAVVASPAALRAFLPEDKVSDFHADSAGCSFKVPGGIVIVLGLDEVVEGERVRYGSRKGTPIRFTLDLVFHSDEENPGRCKGQVKCLAELNPFTKMIAEQALTSLFDTISANLRAAYP